MACPVPGYYEAVESVMQTLGCNEVAAQTWVNHSLNCIRKRGDRPTRVLIVDSGISIQYDRP